MDLEEVVSWVFLVLVLVVTEHFPVLHRNV